MSQPPRSATVELLRPEHAKPMVAFLAVAVVCGFVFANGLRTPEAIVSILKAGAANVVAGTSLLHEPVLGSHIEEQAERTVPQPPSSSARPDRGAAVEVPVVAAPVGASASGADSSQSSAGANGSAGHQSGGAQQGGTTAGTDKNTGSASGAHNGTPTPDQGGAATATQSPGQGKGQGKGQGHGKAGGKTKASAQDRDGGHAAAPGHAKGDRDKARGKKKGHDRGVNARSRDAGRR